MDRCYFCRSLFHEPILCLWGADLCHLFSDLSPDSDKMSHSGRISFSCVHTMPGNLYWIFLGDDTVSILSRSILGITPESEDLSSSEHPYRDRYSGKRGVALGFTPLAAFDHRSDLGSYPSLLLHSWSCRCLKKVELSGEKAIE